MNTALTVLEQQLQPLSPRFADVLGKTMPVERLMRTIVLSVERLPQLLDCDRQSLFNAAMSAACLGLEVDGVTGQAYLIPFKGKAQLVIGYKGMTTMAARSGITIAGACVREGDEFDYELGDKPYLRHKPVLGNRGRIIASWATATAVGRPPIISVLGIDDINAIKGRSPGAKRSDSPWNDPAIGFPAMAEKSAKRRLSRSLPLNVMQLGARMDEAFEEQGQAAWIDPHKGVVIDGDASPFPQRQAEQPTTIELISPPQPHPSRAADTAPGSGSQADPGTFSSDPPSDPAAILAEIETALIAAAEQGMESLKAEWASLAPAHQKHFKPVLDRRLKPRANEVDQENGR